MLRRARFVSFVPLWCNPPSRSAGKDLEGPRPLGGPALDHDLLVGVELDGISSLSVKIAEEAALPSAEGEHRDRRRDAEVEAEVPHLRFVPELAGRSAAPGEEARLVAERRPVDQLDGFVHGPDVDHPEDRAEDLGLS